MNIYDEIKSKVLLSSIVSKSINLVKKGNSYLGLCPFHNEKTPSFTVNDQKGMYYCFGCHAGGDVINFLEKNSNISHSEALELLCNQLGIKLNTDSFEKKVKNDNLLLIMNFVANWYQNRLTKNQEVLSYLQKRNINDSSVAKFGLGYSDENNQLISILQNNYSEEDIIETGLFRKKGNRLYPFFYDRLMFPIMDKQGRIIAFGGRILSKDTDSPKYINSPETRIFAKRNILFNLHNVRKSKNSEVFVVEGYIDVIALDSIGIDAVAPLGTALSDNHLIDLWSLFSHPVLCFDGDSSGKKSALLVAEKTLLNFISGKSISFMFLPEGKDPDDFIRSLSPEKSRIAWDIIYNKKFPLGEFIWDNIKNIYLQNSGPENKLQASKYVEQITCNMKNLTAKKYYLDYFNKQIKYYYKSDKNKYSNTASNVKKISKDNNLVLGKRVEIQILAMLVYHPKLIDENLDFISALKFSHDILNLLRDNILSIRFENQAISSDVMVKNFANLVLMKEFPKEGISVVSYIISDLFKKTYLWSDYNYDPSNDWLELIDFYNSQALLSCDDSNWDLLVNKTKYYKSK